MIVDDEVDVLESLRHLFHRTYRVLTASGGDQALELLKKNEVHLILSDQRMPGMSGDVFLSQARRLQPDAIRMLFTGYADIQAVINAVNEGHIFRYILKPWDAVELEGIIRQAAEQYDLLAERKRLIAELQEANARLTRANEELARGRPAQDRVHRGRQPRVQHADHPGAGPQRAAPAAQPGPERPGAARSSSRSPRAPATRAARDQHADPDAVRRLPPDPPARPGRPGRAPPRGRRPGRCRS